MRFSFNMLLGRIGSTCDVVAAHKANEEIGFSRIRLAGDGGSGLAAEEDVLLIADAASLSLIAAGNCSLPYICICTDVFERIESLVAELPESTSWVAVASENPTQLANGLLDWAESIALWEQRARLTVAYGGDMQELLDDSVSAVGLPIAVCGPLYADYVFTQTLTADDPFFDEISKNGSLSAGSVRKLEEMGVFGNAARDRSAKVFEPNELIRSWHMSRHFRSGGKQVFFVTAWCPEGKPNPGTVELFDKLAQFSYQLYRSKQREGVSSFGQREQALHDLLAGDEPTRETIDETFLKLGISREGLWQVALVKLGDSDDIPKAYHAYLLQRHGERTLAGILDDEIVALLPDDGTCEKALGELERFAERRQGKLGVSSKISDLAEIQSARKQAQFAIRMGSRVSQERVLERMLGIEKDYPSTVFRFDDYLFHELLDHYPLSARGINPGKKPVYELAAYDQANGTQKAKFLYTYMACNGGTGETAKRMGIHRNSVGYQVKSIESILGVDLHDLDFLCHARMAFASIEVLGF